MNGPEHKRGGLEPRSVSRQTGEQRHGPSLRREILAGRRAGAAFGRTNSSPSGAPAPAPRAHAHGPTAGVIASAYALSGVNLSDVSVVRNAQAPAQLDAHVHVRGNLGARICPLGCRAFDLSAL